MFQSQSPIETVLASIVLAICVAMLLRMLLKPDQAARLDARLLRAWRVLYRGLVALVRWPAARYRAARVANEAIRRARACGTTSGDASGNGQWEGEREGNVYKPKAFRRPRKPH